MKSLNSEISAIKLKPIFISDDGLHLHVRVKVNEKSFWMMLDTGATNTVFDIHKIESILKKKARKVNGRLSAGLGGADIQSSKVKIDYFQLGNHVIKKQSFTCLDLTHLNMSYEGIGVKQVIGVIGSDLLYAFEANLDYKEMRLKLFEANAEMRKIWKSIKYIK